MISTMEKSSGNAVGYALSGDVTKADFATVTPAVAAVVEEHGSVCLLLDVTDFHVEKLSALSSEKDFAQQFQGKIDKMAVVGDQKWAKAAAALCDKFGVSDSKFFETDNDAWTWLGA
jgi:hypothetical protein